MKNSLQSQICHCNFLRKKNYKWNIIPREYCDKNKNDSFPEIKVTQKFWRIGLSFEVCLKTVISPFLSSKPKKINAFSNRLNSWVLVTVFSLQIIWYSFLASRCQFHQHFTCKFFVRTLFQQLFSSYINVEKAAVWKIRT